MGIHIHTQELAAALEDGIVRTPSLLADLERSEVLRYPVCGVTALAIQDYAERSGYDTSFLQSNPNWSFDPGARHFVSTINLEDEKPVVVDATPSQFLTYAGIPPTYHLRGETRELRLPDYPPEKVLVFDIDDPYLPAHWLTKAVLDLRERGKIPQADDRVPAPLARANRDRLLDTYTRIWQFTNYRAYDPPVDLVELGRLVGETLPDGLIERI